ANPRIDAGEMPAPRRLQELLQARLGGGQLTVLVEQFGVQEEQLGVVGVTGAAGAAGGLGAVELAQLAVALGQQGVQLADNGVGRVRALEAALQQRQGLGGAALLVVVPAEVEQDVGVVGAVAGVELEEAQVALQLAAARGGVLVAGVLHNDVGEADQG